MRQGDGSGAGQSASSEEGGHERALGRHLLELELLLRVLRLEGVASAGLFPEPQLPQPLQS